MMVKRIIADITAPDPAAAKRFYQDILGLDVLMDLGWIATYGSPSKTSIQVSFMSEGGSGAPIPDLSIEVDDLDEALRRFEKARIEIEYGPAPSPGASGASSCAIRSEGSSTSSLTGDAIRRCA